VPAALWLHGSLRAGLSQELLWLFVAQIGIGTLTGFLVGKLATWSVNRINLDYPGLYPLLALAFGLVAFGAAAVLGGSGFLAVYLAGIVVGSSWIAFRRGIFSFHDATARLGQIVLFVMLGLLSYPSRLLAVAWDGLLIALVLILVARRWSPLCCRIGRPSTHAAASLVISDVSNTPRVERAKAGFHAFRTDSREVRRPPSNRIRARATLPMLLARS